MRTTRLIARLHRRRSPRARLLIAVRAGWRRRPVPKQPQSLLARWARDPWSLPEPVRRAAMRAALGEDRWQRMRADEMRWWRAMALKYPAPIYRGLT